MDVSDPPAVGTAREDALLDGLVTGALSRGDALELYAILEAKLAAAPDDMKLVLAVLVRKAEDAISA